MLTNRFFAISWLLLSAVSLACSAGTDGEPRLVLEPCEIPGAASAECGRLRVPENRDLAAGRTIDLNVVVLPARKKGPDDPILFLHGGPGGAATLLAPAFERSRWRERRAIVLVDQRGTGKSNPLNCPSSGVEALLDELATFNVGDVEACRETLDADLSRYTTSIAVDDLETVRRALGARQVNLIGGSYGTRVALEYMRRYPDSIRTSTLQGTAPPSYSIPSEFDLDSMRALEQVLADCGADAGCRTAFPDIREQLDEVLLLLDKEPGSARIRAPGTGEPTTITVTRQLFAASLHYALYRAATSSRIPYWIRQAGQGRYDELMESTVRFAAALAPQLSMGLFLSVTCAEDIPFYDPEEVVAAARGTLLRGVFSTTLHDACEDWPADTVPLAFKEPVRASVPVLLLSGETDPVTPPRLAEEVARHLDASLHLVLPQMGHSDMTPGCVADLIQRFLDSGTTDGLETECVDSLRRPDFARD